MAPSGTKKSLSDYKPVRSNGNSNSSKKQVHGQSLLSTALSDSTVTPKSTRSSPYSGSSVGKRKRGRGRDEGNDVVKLRDAIVEDSGPQVKVHSQDPGATANVDDEEVSTVGTEFLDKKLAAKIAAVASSFHRDDNDNENFPALGRGLAQKDISSSDEEATMTGNRSNSKGFLKQQFFDVAEEEVEAAGFGFDFNSEKEKEPGIHKTLADFVFEAIEANKRREAEHEKLKLFSEKTLEIYKGVGVFMSRYRSGKLPKAFTIIPSLKNWLDVLWLTNPDRWSSHAHKAATPIFVRGLRDKQLQKYLQFVLLPKVLECIDDHKKLNVHLYEALSSAMFKPTPWFKGIFFPTIKDESCTYKQAVVLCSVISKQSIPVINAGAVLVTLSHTKPYTNIVGYAMVKLINKKHNLPVAVVNSLVSFFEGFLQVEEKLSVVWHQILLSFAQRWKNQLTAEQKNILRLVMKKHWHAKITPEIRKELFGVPAPGRPDNTLESVMDHDDSADAMM